ncbi:uncharacterized protein BN503_00904 [Oscillibacter sp. CAG:155]|nr:uncharacterized protein BN503_00904 [Oscillibacter sp. CAG:155]
MGAVHIGIGHDDDLVIAELIEVELLADAGAQRRDDGLELVVSIDLVRPGLLYVEHLAPQRQNGLEPGIPTLGGGAACGVALDDVDLGEFRVIFVAVPELVRHGRAAQGRLAADGLPGPLGGLPGAVSGKGLVQDHPTRLGIFLQEDLQLFGDDVIHQSADLAVAQLCLGLALELGVGELDGDDAGETLPAVLAGDLLVVLEHLDLAAVSVEHVGQGPLEALLVHAALGGMHVVGKGQDGLVVAVVILHGHFRHGVALHAGHVDHVGVEGILGLVEPGDKLPDAALEAHVVLLLLARALVHGADAQAGVQEGLFPHAGVEGVIVVDGVLKHLRVGLEGDGGAGMIRLAHHGHLLRDMAPGELHLIDLAVPVDLNREPLGEGVDHAGAHAVETAGNLVSAAAELAAGVEDGIDHLQGGTAGLGLDVHGDAAAIIHHGDGIAFVDLHQNVGAVARQGLVDGVIHNLVNQMMET